MWRAVRPWLWSFVGVIVFGYLLYFLSTIGPRRVNSAPIVVKSYDDPVVAKLSGEITELEKQFRKAEADNLVTSEAIDALAQALDKQQELMRICPSVGTDQAQRLMRLETDIAGARAKEKMMEIERLEQDGDEMLSGSESGKAVEKLRAALLLQREVNNSSASSRYKNYVRETALSQKIATVEAEPLKKEMDTFLAKARQATVEQHWAAALSAYIAARNLQTRINREFSRTRYANLNGKDNLDAEIESLNATGIIADIDAKEKAGDEAMIKKHAVESAALFVEASALQLQVNQNFNRSRFVSSQRIENLEIKRQTVLSTETADMLVALDHAIDECLQKRQIVVAGQKINEAVKIINQLFEAFPKSPRLDGALKIKLSYLALHLGVLRTLQDDVYEGLLPLPGVKERMLLKTEVPQSLYVLVINTNPSRNPGRTLPVDSVNWDDAQECCTRLSWLLGTKVRLPSADELRVAMGLHNAEAWSKQNSDGHSHEIGIFKPNDAGFYDLAGNLAEWTSAESDADKALVVGGSYLDEPEVLLKVPQEYRLKSDRVRHVGFRIVVELSSS